MTDAQKPTLEQYLLYTFNRTSTNLKVEIKDVQSGSQIPASIGLYTSLVNISIPFVGLTGPIPVELCNLINLERLDLSGNTLNGPVPPCIGNLVHLRRLDLGSNQLSSSIPRNLTSLVDLEKLSLNSNAFNGTIPDFGASDRPQPKLVILFLFRNQLTGPIPSSIGNIPALQTLLLSNNNLTSSIPSSLTSLVHLERLDLSSNRLEGTIPDFGAVDQPQLELNELKLSDNQLTGPLPTSTGNLHNLVSFNVSYNQLTGPLIPSIGNLTNLQFLDVSNNRFTSTVPASICNLPNLTFLSMGGNPGLEGPMPDTFNLPELTYLNISYTSITSLPSNISQSSKLKSIFFAFAKIESLPPSLFKIPTFLLHLDGSNNGLRGELPSDWILPFHIRLANNKLSGSIPRAAGQKVPEFGRTSVDSLLDFSNNSFTGRPPSVFLLNYLFIDLSRNLLNEDIPAELFKATRELYLNDNQLRGPLPVIFNTSLSLTRLDISRNSLNGSIPPETIASMPNLASIDLSGNLFTGELPDSFSQLYKLENLLLTDCNFTSIPPNLTLSAILSCDISNNTKLPCTDIPATASAALYCYNHCFDQQPKDESTFAQRNYPYLIPILLTVFLISAVIFIRRKRWFSALITVIISICHLVGNILIIIGAYSYHLPMALAIITWGIYAFHLVLNFIVAAFVTIYETEYGKEFEEILDNEPFFSSLITTAAAFNIHNLGLFGSRLWKRYRVFEVSLSPATTKLISWIGAAINTAFCVGEMVVAIIILVYTGVAKSYAIAAAIMDFVMIAWTWVHALRTQ